MNRNTQIKVAAVLSYGIIIFNIFAGLLYTPWMVGQIGEANYGLYILTTSFLTYFTVDFGLWMAINKVLSQLRAEGNIEKEKDVLGITAKIYLFLDVLVCISLFVVYKYLDVIFNNLSVQELYDFKKLFIIAACFSVLSFPFGFIKGVFSAHEFYIETKIYDFINKIGIIFLTVVFLALDIGVYSLVIVYGLVPFILNISRVIYLKKKGIQCNIFYWKKKVAKQIFDISSWLFLVVLAELFINNISPSLIAAFSTMTDVAVFSISLMIYGYVYSFATSISGLLLPKITEMYIKGDIHEFERLSSKIERLQLFVIGFIVLGVVFTGKYFIVAWMGDGFSRSYIIAVLLIAPLLFISLQQVQTSLLLVAGKIKYQAYMMIATAITSVILSVLLIPTLGALGAGIGICVGNFLFMVIGMHIVYNRELKLSFFRVFKTLVPFLFGYSVISIVYMLSLKYIFSNTINRDLTPWMFFVISAIVYILIYSIAIIPLLNKNEKQQIVIVWNKFFK